MKTYKVASMKEMEQFKDEYGYKVDGNLEASCHLNLKGRLLVEGYLSIEAGGSIKAGWYIEAGGSIKAGEHKGISAGLYITCKGVLKYGLKCFAGICVWREITDDEKTITCGKHEGGVIEYGILKETGIENEEVDVTIEGKTTRISRKSAIALGLLRGEHENQNI